MAALAEYPVTSNTFRRETILEESGLLQRLNEIVIPTIAFHNASWRRPSMRSSVYPSNAIPKKWDEYACRPRAWHEGTSTHIEFKNVSLDRISYFIAKASALPADAEDDVIVFRKTEKAVAELIQTHFYKSHALLSSTWQASR